MNCAGSVRLPVNWFTVSHSVTSISPMSMAKPSSGMSIATGTVPIRNSPTKAWLRA